MNYEEELLEYRKKNFNEAKEAICKLELEDWARKKLLKVHEELKSYGEDVGNTFEDFLRPLPPALLACIIMKDPAKQSSHQKIAAKEIESLPGVTNFRMLPASGPKALFFKSGKLVYKGSEKDCTKSIDFSFDYTAPTGNVYHIYAAHKYTKELGGGQDNQYNDLKSQLEQAMLCSDPSIKFLAIADGDYYQKSAGFGKKGISKLEFMNQEYSSNCTRALTIDEVEAFLKTLS